MIQFIVRFSSGGEGDFWEGDFPIKAIDKDTLEYHLLECDGNLNDGEIYFDSFSIYTLDEWITKSEILLK